MINDGDLWEQASGIINQRGPASIKLTKVKGHSTEEQVKQGKVTQEDHDGNNRADDLADKGVEAHGPDICGIGTLFAKRHGAYTKLVGRMQMSALRLMEHIQAIREKKEEEKEEGDEEQRTKQRYHVKPPKKIKYGDERNARHVYIRRPPQKEEGKAKAGRNGVPPCADDIREKLWIFLRSMKWDP